MRIIAGDKKGFKLTTLQGTSTRPTTDFVKEAIFAIIFDCNDLEVLDLFAGSGSLGLEALSRGAKWLDLVDMSEKAVKTIKKNVDKLQYEDRTRIFRQSAENFIKHSGNKYDIILLDPPYGKSLINKTLTAIFEAELLNEDGFVVAEHHHYREKISEQLSERIVKQKKYGDTSITILA
jgi:16S rRNA (guanine966-N2)-methyltransferase